MNPFVLYLLLLKATLTSFSGLASLPVVRSDLVENRHVLTDEQLSTAVIVSRTTPGPVGVYVVSVGYSVAGLPGAIAGWAAMATPAFLIIPMIHYAARRTTHPRMRGGTHAVVAASAGLLLAALVPLARDGLTNVFTILVAAIGAVLMFRNANPFWLVAAASAAGFVAGFIA